MKLNKEEYNEAVGYLKRYNYNCIRIMNIKNDIMSISGFNMDGMPKAPFSNSDPVFNTVLKLQEDKELQKCINEYKIVEQALQLVNQDSKYVFEELYRKGNSKWLIINSGMSEATYKRRKSEIIYAVNGEIKKMSQN